MPTPIIPDPPVPNVMKFRIAGTDGGGNVWNNLEYFQYTGGPPNGGDVLEFAQGVYGEWSGAFIANLPPPYTLESVTCTDLNSVTGLEYVYENTTGGSSSADKLPANVAVVISKLIAARYRGGRPRTYSVVVADENLEDPGHISEAYQVTMNDNYGTFQTGCRTLAFGTVSITDHVAVSYYGHGGPYIEGSNKKLVTPIVWPIVGFDTDLQLGSQRGRIGRRR